jgi:hypothetical protein
MTTERTVPGRTRGNGQDPARVPEAPKKRAKRNVRVTFYIAETLLDELRDVTVALSGPPDRLTLSQLAESALHREVQRLKRLHQAGGDFAKRKHPLRPGRPIR